MKSGYAGKPIPVRSLSLTSRVPKLKPLAIPLHCQPPSGKRRCKGRSYAYKARKRDEPGKMHREGELHCTLLEAFAESILHPRSDQPRVASAQAQHFCGLRFDRFLCTRTQEFLVKSRSSLKLARERRSPLRTFDAQRIRDSLKARRRSHWHLRTDRLFRRNSTQYTVRTLKCDRFDVTKLIAAMRVARQIAVFLGLTVFYLPVLLRLTVPSRN